MPNPASAPILSQNLFQKVAMPDTEASEPKKTVERKKHPQVVNVLKKSVYITTITRCILDLGVNLTVGVLLASAPTIKKQLTKTATKNEAVQFWINTLEPSIVDAQKAQSWYFMGSLKSKLRQKNGSKVIIFLDTSAKINVMT